MAVTRVEIEVPDVVEAEVTHDALVVEFSDGRAMSVPLAWYPRLVHATLEERSNWRLTEKGQGLHWDDLDLDISVEDLLAGRRSAESEASFKRWLAERATRH